MTQILPTKHKLFPEVWVVAWIDPSGLEHEAWFNTQMLALEYVDLKMATTLYEGYGSFPFPPAA